MIQKVILVASSFDPAHSFEYIYFLQPLEKLVEKVIPFDFFGLLRTETREDMNRKLFSLVQRECPDAVLFVPYTDQFIPEIITEINQCTTTIGYFFDDMWRIEYSRFWARYFTYVTTSDVNGVRKFQDAGFHNVIYSPFGCNENVYSRRKFPKLYDVSFVGQYHPQREWYINYLRKERIAVHVWGNGWPNGPLKTEDVAMVFNSTRINLNLSNCVAWDVRYLTAFQRPIRNTLRAWKYAFDAIYKSDRKIVEQVKARHFEINACGGAQLSYYVEGLERHYNIGTEIAVYTSPEDFVDKVCYYLKHEEQREEMAKRGYERTVQDHTMEQRLKQLLGDVMSSKSSGGR